MDLRDWASARAGRHRSHAVAAAPVQTVLESLDAQRRRVHAVYDRVRVEPTDESFLDAIAFATQHDVRRASSRSAAARRSTPRRR